MDKMVPNICGLKGKSEINRVLPGTGQLRVTYIWEMTMEECGLARDGTIVRGNHRSTNICHNIFRNVPLNELHLAEMLAVHQVSGGWKGSFSWLKAKCSCHSNASLSHRCGIPIHGMQQGSVG
ncbi:hypothetical protein O181_005671 [Austropuccinia psidii MF-1]|uniref:Uncharacterized protein n=1 Tax=Austropuccinia psidii MF-1 TaxID=1389203 RepID=A0A9Q3GG36_9BASI|nr:hypothetical protein [Austropuccinia psidii MF-1]